MYVGWLDKMGLTSQLLIGLDSPLVLRKSKAGSS